MTPAPESFAEARLVTEECLVGFNALIVQLRQAGRSARRKSAGDTFAMLQKMRELIVGYAELMRRGEELEAEVVRLRRQLSQPHPAEESFLTGDDQSLFN